MGAKAQWVAIKPASFDDIHVLTVLYWNEEYTERIKKESKKKKNANKLYKKLWDPM